VNYSLQQFSRCLYNPLEKNLIKTYPRLLGLFPNEDERPAAEREKLLRYIIALYDPASPLKKELPDLNIRKQQAAILAGYDLVKDADQLELIYAFMAKVQITEEGKTLTVTATDSVLVDVVDGFLKRHIQSRLWAMICSFEQTWWEWNARMMKPVMSLAGKDKDEMQAIQIKSKIAEEMDKLNTKLDEYYDKFYHGDSQLQEAVKKRITPESIAGI
jgi:hypothetical protein